MKKVLFYYIKKIQILIIIQFVWLYKYLYIRLPLFPVHDHLNSTQTKHSLFLLLIATSMMEVGCGQSYSYLRLESLDQESFPLVTLMKSIVGKFPMYRVAKASEYLVITGAGIHDIKLAKRAWIYPSQSFMILDISPTSYTFKVQAMSADKLSFFLPCCFVIGPRFDNVESLYKYAKLTMCPEKDSTSMHELVKGVIEVETRVLAASSVVYNTNQNQ